MASNEPFEQLTGTLTVYLAPTGETVPAVSSTPGGNWVELGSTDGQQKLKHGGALTRFYDNDHQGPVKAVRPQEDIEITFMLVGLTLENYARVLDRVADVTSDAGPPATKTMPLKRGYTPNEYAVLLKGAALSPYGAFPGQYVIPRAVFDDEPEPTFGKGDRVGLDCKLVPLEDPDTASDANKMGYLIVQTA